MLGASERGVGALGSLNGAKANLNEAGIQGERRTVLALLILLRKPAMVVVLEVAVVTRQDPGKLG
jgi:hypothetical protein